MRRALSRWEIIDDPLQNETTAFDGILPHFHKKVSNDVKEGITQFWYSSSRVSPNVKDMLKLTIDIIDHTLHPKHYLEVSQTMLFKEFRESHPRLHISQRDFESLKPFYYAPFKFKIHVITNIMWIFLCTMNYYIPSILLCIVKKCWRIVVLVGFQNRQETC